MTKTISELNEKMWYRFIKVVWAIIWILLFVLATIGSLGQAPYDYTWATGYTTHYPGRPFNWVQMFEILFWGAIILEAIRGIFIYIVTGKNMWANQK
jgi:hypothetical protein